METFLPLASAESIFIFYYYLTLLLSRPTAYARNSDACNYFTGWTTITEARCRRRPERAYLTGEPRPVSAALVDRVDQEPVEHGQHQQRHAYERDNAKPIVRLLVDVVPAQFGAALLELARRRVDGYVPFVRRGRRARDAEQRDHQDDAFGPGLGAQYAAAERMAHGYVPFNGERHGQQHRRVTCGTQPRHIIVVTAVRGGVVWTSMIYRNDPNVTSTTTKVWLLPNRRFRVSISPTVSERVNKLPYKRSKCAMTE